MAMWSLWLGCHKYREGVNTAMPTMVEITFVTYKCC